MWLCRYSPVVQVLARAQGPAIGPRKAKGILSPGIECSTSLLHAQLHPLLNMSTVVQGDEDTHSPKIVSVP